MQRITATLLAHANRVPSLFDKTAFYQVKNQLLEKYAAKDGYDLQVLAAKMCYRCAGTGYWHSGEECYYCGGTGEYLPQKTVLLQRYSWYGYIFHGIADSPLRQKSWYSASKNIIHGHIKHNSPKMLLVYLFYLFFIPKLLCKEIKTTFWRKLQKAKKVIYKLKNKVENHYYYDDDLPF